MKKFRFVQVGEKIPREAEFRLGQGWCPTNDFGRTLKTADPLYRVPSYGGDTDAVYLLDAGDEIKKGDTIWRGRWEDIEDRYYDRSGGRIWVASPEDLILRPISTAAREFEKIKGRNAELEAGNKNLKEAIESFVGLTDLKNYHGPAQVFMWGKDIKNLPQYFSSALVEVEDLKQIRARLFAERDALQAKLAACGVTCAEVELRRVNNQLRAAVQDNQEELVRLREEIRRHIKEKKTLAIQGINDMARAITKDQTIRGLEQQINRLDEKNTELYREIERRQESFERAASGWTKERTLLDDQAGHAATGPGDPSYRRAIEPCHAMMNARDTAQADLARAIKHNREFAAANMRQANEIEGLKVQLAKVRDVVGS